jgi:hypothetical protein
MRIVDVVELGGLLDDELREVALSADAWLVIDAARAYGFTIGGPNVDVARCEAAIDIAHGRGLSWTDEACNTRAARIAFELQGEPAC